MHEKDPNSAEYIVEWLKAMLPYISTILLSTWGGVVHHIQRIRATKISFNWRELLFDIAVSSFAGILTYFFCQSAGIEGPKAALLIAISGHMGTRAISSFQTLHERIFAKEKASK